MYNRIKDSDDLTRIFNRAGNVNFIAKRVTNSV
jgi:hypothetical protein